MDFLTKNFKSVYGITANHHAVIIKSINITANGDYQFPDLQIHAYCGKSEKSGGKKMVDCFRPNLTYTVTRAERSAESGEDDERMQKALMKKITSSVLDANNKETNLWKGNAGLVDYVGSSKKA